MTTRTGGGTSEDAEFGDFFRRLKAGDEEAGRELHARYCNQLVGVARRCLKNGIRSKVDPEDIVQEVLIDFLEGVLKDQYQLSNWKSLWGLLWIMIVRKCRAASDFYGTQQRDVLRELSLDAGKSWTQPEGEDIPPEDLLTRSEIIEESIGEFESPLERQIARLFLEGKTNREISREVGCSEHIVRRVVRCFKERFRRRWKDARDGE